MRDELLTDAQVAARLGLEIRQFHSALRSGLIPQPRLIAGRKRWTPAQRAYCDPRSDAEAAFLDAVERLKA